MCGFAGIREGRLVEKVDCVGKYLVTLFKSYGLQRRFLLVPLANPHPVSYASPPVSLRRARRCNLGNTPPCGPRCCTDGCTTGICCSGCTSVCRMGTGVCGVLSYPFPVSRSQCWWPALSLWAWSPPPMVEWGQWGSWLLQPTIVTRQSRRCWRCGCCALSQGLGVLHRRWRRRSLVVPWLPRQGRGRRWRRPMSSLLLCC